jgi:hypothetical protein
MMSTIGMELPLSLVKDSSGALDSEWVTRLARVFGLRGFIETGTYLGHSLENVCGSFERAVSIELSPELHQAALQKFADRPNVILLQGDSARRIVDATALCAGLPTLYWLDAHWSAGNTARGEENTPILTELALIADRVSPDDVVLIDDMRQFISLPEGFAIHDAHAGYPMIDEVLRVLADFPSGGFQAVLSGDILVCLSRERMNLLRVSPVVRAITALRTNPSTSPQERRVYERQIGRARGVEREVLLALPKHYEHALQFGIGGDFCYWRALVKEAEWDFDAARADLEMARRCNVHVPPRSWEGTGLFARVQRGVSRLIVSARVARERRRAAAVAMHAGPDGAEANPTPSRTENVGETPDAHQANGSSGAGR